MKFCKDCKFRTNSKLFTFSLCGLAKLRNLHATKTEQLCIKYRKNCGETFKAEGKWVDGKLEIKNIEK